MLGGLALAGCAESGDTVADGGLEELYDSALVDLAQFDATLTAEGAVVPVADLPVTGMARYTAVAAITASAGPGLVGRGDIRADFLAGTISGRLEGFLGPIDRSDPTTAVQLTGAVVVAGEIGAGPEAITGTMQGDLTGAGHVVQVEGTLAGDFWDADGGSAPPARNVDGLILRGETELVVDGEAVTGSTTIVSY